MLEQPQKATLSMTFYPMDDVSYTMLVVVAGQWLLTSGLEPSAMHTLPIHMYFSSSLVGNFRQWVQGPKTVESRVVLNEPTDECHCQYSEQQVTNYSPLFRVKDDWMEHCAPSPEKRSSTT